jgi:DHA1 family bicyclomycin/chloramphenicol resistance-like MFS transporter
MLKADQKNFIFWIPLFLIIYNFAANLANDIYLPSMAKLVHIFGTTSTTLQLTMTFWFAGVAIPHLYFGPLTDAIGRRPVLFAGAICIILATIACGLSPNVWCLIIARFFQGVGVCSLNVCTFGILIDLYDYKNRTQIMNKISMCGNLAPLVGPIIGGYVLVWLNWRANFFLIFILGIASIIGLWKKLPESNLNLNPDAIKIKNLYLNYYLLLKNNGEFLKNMLPYCLILGGLVAYLTSAPFIVIERLKVLPQNFGYTQLPICGAYLLGSLYLSYADDEEKIKKILSFGIKLVLLAGGLMLVSGLIWGNNLYGFVGPMIIYSLGFSLSASPLINEVMSNATASKGSAAAFLGFGMAVSCVLSCVVLGLIYNGKIISVATLLFTITMLVNFIYFKPAKAPKT